MSVDFKCERVTKTWEDLPDRRDLRDFDWTKRHWFADTRHGHLVMAEVQTDKDTGEILDIRETRAKEDRQVPFFSYQETEAIYKIAQETDCTIMEAVIAFVGKENLPETWIQRALKAPVVRYKYAIPYQEAIKKPEPKVDFVDPRTKVASQEDRDEAKKEKQRQYWKEYRRRRALREQDGKKLQELPEPLDQPAVS